MRIASVRSHILEAPSRSRSPIRAWYDARAAMVVEIETDGGLVGWGRAALTRFAAR
jgi:D-galactarolactone cycloisomerase